MKEEKKIYVKTGLEGSGPSPAGPESENKTIFTAIVEEMEKILDGDFDIEKEYKKLMETIMPSFLKEEKDYFLVKYHDLTSKMPLHTTETKVLTQEEINNFGPEIMIKEINKIY